MLGLEACVTTAKTMYLFLKWCLHMAEAGHGTLCRPGCSQNPLKSSYLSFPSSGIPGVFHSVQISLERSKAQVTGIILLLVEECFLFQSWESKFSS